MSQEPTDAPTTSSLGDGVPFAAAPVPEPKLPNWMLQICTPLHFERVLDFIRAKGVKTLACKEAGISPSALDTYFQSFPAERERLNMAFLEYRESLVVEATRRGVEGVDKPIFYKGDVVGHVTEYSDRLLEKMLDANGVTPKDPASAANNPANLNFDYNQLSFKAREEVRILMDRVKAIVKADLANQANTTIDITPNANGNSIGVKVNEANTMADDPPHEGE